MKIHRESRWGGEGGGGRASARTTCRSVQNCKGIGGKKKQGKEGEVGEKREGTRNEIVKYNRVLPHVPAVRACVPRGKANRLQFRGRVLSAGKSADVQTRSLILVFIHA